MMRRNGRQSVGKRGRSIRYVFKEMSEILLAIDQNEDISYRQLVRVLKRAKQATITRRLRELCELAMIEKWKESIGDNSQTRGLKPRYLTHYRITEVGKQYLWLVWEQTPDVRRE